MIPQAYQTKDAPWNDEPPETTPEIDHERQARIEAEAYHVTQEDER